MVMEAFSLAMLVGQLLLPGRVEGTKDSGSDGRPTASAPANEANAHDVLPDLMRLKTTVPPITRGVVSTQPFVWPRKAGLPEATPKVEITLDWKASQEGPVAWGWKVLDHTPPVKTRATPYEADACGGVVVQAGKGKIEEDSPVVFEGAMCRTSGRDETLLVQVDVASSVDWQLSIQEFSGILENPPAMGIRRLFFVPSPTMKITRLDFTPGKYRLMLSELRLVKE